MVGSRAWLRELGEVQREPGIWKIVDFLRSNSFAASSGRKRGVAEQVETSFRVPSGAGYSLFKRPIPSRECPPPSKWLLPFQTRNRIGYACASIHSERDRETPFHCRFPWKTAFLRRRSSDNVITCCSIVLFTSDLRCTATRLVAQSNEGWFHAEK